MNRGMEHLISKDLDMDISKIRESSWSELTNLPYKRGRAFRPKNMFLVSGNINLAQNRTMGIYFVNLRNICRKVLYKIKCLLKHRKM